MSFLGCLFGDCNIIGRFAVCTPFCLSVVSATNFHTFLLPSVGADALIDAILEKVSAGKCRNFAVPWGTYGTSIRRCVLLFVPLGLCILLRSLCSFRWLSLSFSCIYHDRQGTRPFSRYCRSSPARRTRGGRTDGLLSAPRVRFCRDVRVFHGLRLEHAGDAAQIDHLVLHRWGMILIESKSVTTRVRVNAQGEWMRWHDGRWHGMPSPTLQVERQAAFLRARLREHAEELLGKVLGLQVRFGNMPLDTFVAISDQGIIERPKGALPQVCKADQIAGQITTLLEAYRKANSPSGSADRQRPLFWHTFKAGGN